MTDIAFCLFILKGEGEEVVHRNQRFMGTIETTASVVKRELIAVPDFSQVSCVKITTKFLSLLNMNRI